jgi:RNA polymerase sigma-70 factor (ECF subfamily)
MQSPSITHASLLLRIRDPDDHLAWREFVGLYAPLVHAYGRHHGLQDADAADLVQEVFRRVAKASPQFEYDRARGTFRGWLYTVTRNELFKMGRARKEARGSGDTAVQGLLAQEPERDQDGEDWDREYHWNLFLWAAERVKSEFRTATWQAFWRTVVEAAPIEPTAKELNLSVGAVYIARSRIIARIRQEVVLAESEGGPR